MGKRKKAAIFFSFIAFLSTCKARVLENKSAVTDSYSPAAMTPALIANGMDYIHRLMADKNPKNLSEFLESLDGELLSNYTLVYQSRSLQDASETHPRVLLYREDGSLFIAYTGAEQSKDINRKVEIIGYDDEHFSYEFRTLDFSNNESPLLSQPNPVECSGCHKATGTLSGRPNWDPYPFWPGAYGSNDDSMVAEEGKSKRISYEVKGVLSPQAEGLAFKKFLSANGYNLNEPIPPNPAYWPLTNMRSRFAPNRSNRADKEYVARNHGVANTKMSVAVHNSNTRRLIRYFMSSKNFEKSKAAIYAALDSPIKFAIKNLLKDEQGQTGKYTFSEVYAMLGCQKVDDSALLEAKPDFFKSWYDVIRNDPGPRSRQYPYFLLAEKLYILNASCSLDLEMDFDNFSPIFQQGAYPPFRAGFAFYEDGFSGVDNLLTVYKMLVPHSEELEQKNKEVMRFIQTSQSGR